MQDYSTKEHPRCRQCLPGSSDAAALSFDGNVTPSPASGDGAFFTPTGIKAGTKGDSLVRKDNAVEICTKPSFHYPKIAQEPTNKYIPQNLCMDPARREPISRWCHHEKFLNKHCLVC